MVACTAKPISIGLRPSGKSWRQPRSPTNRRRKSEKSWRHQRPRSPPNRPGKRGAGRLHVRRQRRTVDALDPGRGRDTAWQLSSGLCVRFGRPSHHRNEIPLMRSPHFGGGAATFSAIRRHNGRQGNGLQPGPRSIANATPTHVIRRRIRRRKTCKSEPTTLRATARRCLDPFHVPRPSPRAAQILSVT